MLSVDRKWVLQVTSGEREVHTAGRLRDGESVTESRARDRQVIGPLDQNRRDCLPIHGKTR
jgi:hypothetical protein